MKPHLLPVGEKRNDFIDYTHSVITRHYILEDSKYYFTLHSEHYPDSDALVHTGRYLAVILMPKGIKAFYIIKDISGNYNVDYDADNENPAHTLSKINGFTTDFASAIQQEINQRVNELKDFMKMINVALKEHIGVI